MTGGDDLAATARRIVESAMYLTLATADRKGRPWASPVWFAPETRTRLLWVSKPDARHSLNLAVRPEAGAVIFDSTVPVGRAEAVYMDVNAEEVTGADLEHAIAIYSRRSLEVGVREWTLADVTTPAPLRLYRAAASAVYVLGPGDRRVPVQLT